MAGQDATFDVFKLCNAIRMLTSFTGLAMGLQAVAQLLEQPSHGRRAHLEVLTPKLRSKGCRTHASISQRVCGIAASDRAYQAIQRSHQPGLFLNMPLSSSTGPTLPARWEPFRTLQLPNSSPNSTIGQPCRLGDGCDSTAPQRTGLRGRPSPSPPLVEFDEQIDIFRSNPMNDIRILHARNMVDSANWGKSISGNLF
jgi:hypothetical protein